MSKHPNPRDYADPRQREAAEHLRSMRLRQTRRVRVLTWVLSNWLLSLIVAAVGLFVLGALLGW